jgi:hypothetical protein
MAYKQQGSPFQRNFGIGSPAKQMLKPRVAPVAAPVNAPVNAPVAPPVDPAMIAQAAKAVKGAMAPPPVDPGAEMPPPMQRNLRMEAASPVKFTSGMRRAVRTARPKTAKPMSVGVGGGTTGSVNQPTTGGPQKGIVSTTPLPGGDKKGVKRTGGGGRRRGLLGGLARGVKSMGKAVRGAVGSGMSGIAKTAKVVEGARNLAKGVGEKVGGLAKGAIKDTGGLAKGVAKAGLGGAVKAVKPVVRAAAGIAKGAGGLVSKVIKK